MRETTDEDGIKTIFDDDFLSTVFAIRIEFYSSIHFDNLHFFQAISFLGVSWKKRESVVNIQLDIKN